MMKRGAISIETIIIIILALLVLVIVAASFTGGMNQLWKKIIGISETAELDSLSTAVVRCGDICRDSKEAFCTASFIIKDLGARNCKDITNCEGAPC